MCLFVDGDGDYLELKAPRWVTARKRHRCYECGRDIEPGERYETWTGVVEWGIFTGKICAHCRATVTLGSSLTGCPERWAVEELWDADPDFGFAANILHDEGHDLTAEQRNLMRELIDAAAAKWRNPDGSLMPVPAVPESGRRSA